MGLNFKDSKKATLDYLVKDFHNTVDDAKTIKNYFTNNASKIALYTLLGAFAFNAATGCGSRNDNDTKAGSSGTPAVTLSKAGKDALELRFSQPELFMTAAGLRAPDVDAKAESDEWLGRIAKASASNAYANGVLQILNDADEASLYDELGGENPGNEYNAFTKFYFNTLRDGIAATQTEDLAPFYNIKIVNNEVDFNRADSGSGIAVDFAGGKVRIYDSDKDSKEGVRTYKNITPENMAKLKGYLKDSIELTYIKNESNDKISVTYSQISGEQIIDSKPGQAAFDE